MVKLDKETIRIVKSTAPVLKEHGQAIVNLFYENLFKEYDVTKGIFNMTHQRSTEHHPHGAQPEALANAVYAYASNIDNLGALLPAVDIITQKHVSFGEGLIRAI